MSRARRGFRSWGLLLLIPICSAHAELLDDAPGRFSVDIARPIKREIKQNETDSGTVVICDLFHTESNVLEWITYSDYPKGTMADRDPAKIYNRWPKGEAATHHGKLRSTIIHPLGETVGREFIIDMAEANKVVRARVYIVGDRTYRISYTGPTGTEDSPAARQFLDSFTLKP